MKRMVMILGLVVITGYLTPDLSRAHSHVLVLPQNERPSLIPTEPVEFIGPVLKGTEGVKSTEQSSWSRFSLTHTDTHYLSGNERHHSSGYRSFSAPDGLALMFSWPFADVSTFWMNPQESSNEPTPKQDNPR